MPKSPKINLKKKKDIVSHGPFCVLRCSDQCVETVETHIPSTVSAAIKTNEKYLCTQDMVLFLLGFIPLFITGAPLYHLPLLAYLITQEGVRVKEGEGSGDVYNMFFKGSGGLI